MATLKVLPRDLQPGDQIDRLDANLDVVPATVKEVRKVHAHKGHTAYKVSFVEYDDLTSSQRNSGHRHLLPAVFQARQQITVQRTEA